MAKKIKYVRLEPNEKEFLLKLYNTPKMRDPLTTKQFKKVLADFQKRFAKMSRECNSELREFSCFALKDILWHAGKFIDERFEILDTTMFKCSVDNEYLIWDELDRGRYFDNVLLVLNAKNTFLQIMLLMSEKELKIPVLLSLFYKLGLCMQAFFAMRLVQPAAAKRASLDKAKLGGRGTAKLRPKDISLICTWFEELEKESPDKKRKTLYTEVMDKWNKTYPDRKKVCVRTVQKYLKQGMGTSWRSRKKRGQTS